MRIAATHAWHKVVRRGWRVARTRLLWGWRLHSLGARSELARRLMVNNPAAVSIGSRVTVQRDYVFADLCPSEGTFPKIVIGDDCTILYRFQCNAALSVWLGNNVLVASNVLITDSDHVVEPDSTPVTENGRFVSRPVCIMDNCWIGQNAVILKGVTVGPNSIVGAGAIVTRDVPPSSIVAGNPARVLRMLE